VASVVAAAVGAGIALVATVVADLLRSRRDRLMSVRGVRQECYLLFMLALQQANDALRAIGPDDADRSTAAGAALRESGLYGARERLLVTGSPQMVLAGETVFRSLLDLRDAIAGGQSLIWPDYRPATDRLAAAVWALRQTARTEFDGRTLDLDQIHAVQAAAITDRLRQPADPGQPARTTPHPEQAPPPPT
jgi:hypothetical protein